MTLNRTHCPGLGLSNPELRGVSWCMPVQETQRAKGRTAGSWDARQTRHPGHKPPRPPAAASAVNLCPPERTRVAQRRSRLYLGVARVPEARPPPPGCQGCFPVGFSLGSSAGGIWEIFGTLAWLSFSKSALIFRLSPASLTRQGAIMC